MPTCGSAHPPRVLPQPGGPTSRGGHISGQVRAHATRVAGADANRDVERLRAIVSLLQAVASKDGSAASEVAVSFAFPSLCLPLPSEVAVSFASPRHVRGGVTSLGTAHAYRCAHSFLHQCGAAARHQLGHFFTQVLHAAAACAMSLLAAHGCRIFVLEGGALWTCDGEDDRAEFTLEQGGIVGQARSHV